jgi:hypothetical protein
MKRAGVSRDICERCLAHMIGGVEGTYDRYDYLRERREAFDRLAVRVERIVNPPSSDNVVNCDQCGAVKTQRGELLHREFHVDLFVLRSQDLNLRHIGNVQELRYLRRSLEARDA